MQNVELVRVRGIELVVAAYGLREGELLDGDASLSHKSQGALSEIREVTSDGTPTFSE